MVGEDEYIIRVQLAHERFFIPSSEISAVLSIFILYGACQRKKDLKRAR